MRAPALKWLGWAVFALLVGSGNVPALAADPTGLVDFAQRRKDLTGAAFKPARAACLAVPARPEWRDLAPVMALEATEGYGSDRSAADVSLAAMVLSGRALAGDEAAEKDLAAILANWAAAGAFLETKQHYDPYFALKRTLLPLITGYDIARSAMAKADRERVKKWLDTLVRRVDATFNGEVDLNNHRYLADAVLALWGGTIGDDALVEKGRKRFLLALEEMRADGSLALELRRGARALWYQRQTLANFTVIAAIDARQGGKLLTTVHNGKSLDTMLAYLLNGLVSPTLVASYAAQNYIPGPTSDYRDTDLGFLDNRGNGRHYMAFAEALLASGADSLSIARLRSLVDAAAADERPLIDEFIGGNATCFWWRP